MTLRASTPGDSAGVDGRVQEWQIRVRMVIVSMTRISQTVRLSIQSCSSTILDDRLWIQPEDDERRRDQDASNNYRQRLRIVLRSRADDVSPSPSLSVELKIPKSLLRLALSIVQLEETQLCASG